MICYYSFSDKSLTSINIKDPEHKVGIYQYYAIHILTTSTTIRLLYIDHIEEEAAKSWSICDLFALLVVLITASGLQGVQPLVDRIM